MSTVKKLERQQIIVEDRPSLTGTVEVVGPYLDMVCMSEGDSYNNPVVCLIAEPDSTKVKGIVKIEYDRDQRQKVLFFSQFDGLDESTMHRVIKDLNRNRYDFKIYKTRVEKDEIKGYKAFTADVFLGVSYFKYQQLLTSDDSGRPSEYDDLTETGSELIG